MDGLWIEKKDKDDATIAGYTVVDSAHIISVHISQIIKYYAEEILTRQDVKNLIDRLKDDFPSLVADSEKIPLGVIHQVLKELLHDEIPIKDMLTILETIVEVAPGAQNSVPIIMDYVRSALSRVITDMLKDDEIRAEYEKYRKLRNDPRVTKFGKILREKSLDEFPQFINILKGEMSIVGPRPYLPEEKERMGKYYNYIVQHKPGLTGVFQISGRERVAFSERLDMDLRYHYRRTFLVDLKIALITMLVTLRRKKTYNVGELTLDTLGYISRGFTLFIKRIIDIIGAIVGIAILIPLTVIVWIGNRICKDKGPIFYSQERIGKNGKIFKMYKFRSMVVGAEQILEELLEKDAEAREEYSAYKKLKNDPRITKMGNILRKTSLDEFPQFINVLKGDMSLVGPRAYLPEEKVDMEQYYETIIASKPGITGLWQVSGRSNTTFEKRLQYDLEYNRKKSISFDVEILFKTVISIAKKEGAM